MIEKIKYLIKDKNTNLYLSPYNYKNHWVKINDAEFFDIQNGIEKAEDLVDLIWIEDKEVELIKVKLKIEIEEIKEKKIKESFILTKEKELKLKEIYKNYRKQKEYNQYGTKLKKISITENIIYNLIKNKNYLNGIILSKNKFFTTNNEIQKSKNKIYNILNDKSFLSIELRDFFTQEELLNLSNKLKKQIEED